MRREIGRHVREHHTLVVHERDLREALHGLHLMREVRHLRLGAALLGIAILVALVADGVQRARGLLHQFGSKAVSIHAELEGRLLK